MLSGIPFQRQTEDLENRSLSGMDHRSRVMHSTLKMIFMNGISYCRVLELDSRRSGYCEKPDER